MTIKFFPKHLAIKFEIKMEIQQRSTINESSSKINNIRRHHKRVSQCTACGGPLAQSRVTFTNSASNHDNIINNNVPYYSNDLHRNTSTNKTCNNNESDFVQTKRVGGCRDIQTPIKITTTNLVKHNNICVKYVNTPLPKQEHFHISPKCVKRKLWSFTYTILPQKYKHIISKKNKVSKFDRCRPMIVSLECKCGGKEKMHITKKSQQHTLFDKNFIFPQCTCDSSFEGNLGNKLNKKGENLCSNGCAASLENDSYTPQDKNSICSWFLSR